MHLFLEGEVGNEHNDISLVFIFVCSVFLSLIILLIDRVCNYSLMVEEKIEILRTSFIALDR